MRAIRVLTVALCAGASTLVGTGSASADVGNSDAAHMCGDGLQFDEYLFDGQPGLELPAAFLGDLPHGSGLPGVAGPSYAWVLTDGHGQCVSFFAQAKKAGASGGKVKVSEIQFVRKVDVSSPNLG